MEFIMPIPKLKKEVRIAEFDSMQQKQTYLIILNDRQWQISEEIKQVVDLIDGQRSVEQIATCLSEKFGKPVRIEVINKIVTGLLTSRGILENSVLPPREDSIRSKYLWFKRVILKTKYVKKFHFLTMLLDKYVFFALSVIASVVLMTLLSRLLDPRFMKNVMLHNFSYFIEFFLFSSFVVFVHELGHMAACMRFGIEPGEIGIGIYFSMPVLYSDVSRTWQLKRKERLMVDLGGVYFEGVALALSAGVAYFTGNAKLLDVVTLSIFSILFSLNPFIKMDGYWVFTDLTGIANLHRTMREFIKSKWYSFFGIKVGCGIDLYEMKMKRLFYIYTLMSLIYILFFSASMIQFILTFLGGLPRLIYLLNVNMAQKSFAPVLTGFLKIIYDNVFILFGGFAVINIIYLAVKGVYKTAVTFIEDVKRHRNLNE